ncbi:hypothetical protein [Streptomyces sp. NPDC017941]|uniref:hypothetical protein n=1 Tax=Streptomyces sp. NPDC017941 TaxID=3365018 RepID=UPI0037B7A19E
MDDSSRDVETLEVKAVTGDAADLSSRILEISNLRGKVTEGAPSVYICEGKDSEKFYTVYHNWSLYKVPVPDMEKAMKRLRDELPEHGWKVVSYGPDSSRARSLELTADHLGKKFSAIITLQDRRGRSKNPSMIEVEINSSCFQVPAGQTVGDAH